jgi:hypothetical protein
MSLFENRLTELMITILDVILLQSRGEVSKMLERLVP